MEVRDTYAPLIGFKSRKAAQGAAYFARKSGGRIEKLKLIKLMYLSERLMFERRERPMFYDQYFSMEHGPVCSSTLNGVNGRLNRQVWGSRVELDGHSVLALKSTDDVDEFSDLELDFLEEIWEKFGHMTSSQIRQYTHDNCPEYTEVASGGRVPISDLDILQAIGSDDPAMAASEISEYRRIESLLLS